MSNTIKIEPIDQIGISIVNLMGKVGIYHYNKLAYLFEYFFIKNFGKRFSKEYFIKLPHGPVIKNYKKRITKLASIGLIDVDMNILNQDRDLDDYKIFIPISATDKTNSFAQLGNIEHQLLKSIVNKFGYLSINELEDIVYQSQPLINYKHNPYKKEIGGYVLDGPGIKIKAFKTPEQIGRELARKHLQKYHSIDFDQHKRIADELKIFERMRPEI